MKYPEKIEDHNIKLIWRYEDCFKVNNEFNLVRCYTHCVSPLLGMHCHSFYEINIVLSGEGRHYIDERSCNAKVGMVFVIPPEIRHGYYSNGKLIVYHILISCAFIQRFLKELSSLNGYSMLFEIEPLLRGEFKQNLFLQLSDEKIQEIIPTLNYLEISDSLNNTNIQISRNATVLKMISDFCDNISQNQSIKTLKPEKKVEIEIIKIMEYVNINCSEKINFHSIALNYNMSYATFLRKFKKISSKTPEQYLLQCRISKSKKLLEFTDKSVVEIALESGFYDSSHFIHLFKESEGINPTEYRK